MKHRAFTAGWWIAALTGALLSIAVRPAADAASSTPLDLDGYAEPSGAITTLHRGDLVDPYFVVQALLLAREHGLDIGRYNGPWLDWLATRQKLDGTFDRFCRAGPVWLGCRAADADDALLALWIRLLRTSPAELARRPALAGSMRRSAEALSRLYDGRRGVYLVSPTFQQALFMDNLEIWSSDVHPVGSDGNRRLSDAIHATFWDAGAHRFLVSTQPEQADAAPRFYPDAVAQIYPLLLGYPRLPADRHAYYRRWMTQHRRDWLERMSSDFAWGIVALIALREHDKESAACWLRDAMPLRYTPHWALPDEVSYQVLRAHRIAPAAASAPCG